MKEIYQKQIQSDIREFYREMESYVSLFENRIQRFKAMVDRGEEIAVKIQTKETETALDEIQKNSPPIKISVERAPTQEKEFETRTKPKIQAPVKKLTKAKAAVKNSKLKPVVVKKTKQNEKPETIKIAAEKPKQAETAKNIPVTSTVEKRPPIQSNPVEIDYEEDLAAYELVKDLYPTEHVDISRLQARVEDPAKKITDAPPKTEGAMSKFFSRVGQAIEPMVFSEKKEAPKATLNSSTSTTIVNSPDPNFREVLQRAESIKREKERARLENQQAAREEFFANGDVFRQSQSSPIQPKQEEPNRLIKRTLDSQTMAFLIETVKDMQLRKQALRTLLEHNVSIDEIASRSQIDRGELDLVRQLNRF